MHELFLDLPLGGTGHIPDSYQFNINIRFLCFKLQHHTFKLKICFRLVKLQPCSYLGLLLQFLCCYLEFLNNNFSLFHYFWRRNSGKKQTCLTDWCCGSFRVSVLPVQIRGSYITMFGIKKILNDKLNLTKLITRIQQETDSDPSKRIRVTLGLDPFKWTKIIYFRQTLLSRKDHLK